MSALSGPATTPRSSSTRSISSSTAPSPARFAGSARAPLRVDDNNQPVEPYYKVRVALSDPITLHNVPDGFRLVPGMTLIGRHPYRHALAVHVPGERRRARQSAKRCASPDGRRRRSRCRPNAAGPGGASLSERRRGGSRRRGSAGAAIPRGPGGQALRHGGNHGGFCRYRAASRPPPRRRPQPTDITRRWQRIGRQTGCAGSSP